MAKRKAKPTASLNLLKRKAENLDKKSDKNGSKPQTISLQVSGGVHSEKYDFNFDLDQNGRLKCGLECRLTDRKVELKQIRLKDNEIKKLWSDIESTGIIHSKGYMGQFIPCTLVGILTIQMYDRQYHTRFIADSEQAKMQKIKLEKVDEAVDILYKLAANKMKIKSARPSMK